ncbi:MAG: M42 family metallopeptidase [Clostridia bacterium]|nr:M42 family metallopeptidase [Clostridia bacterium]
MPVADIIYEEVKKFCTDIKFDNMGNLKVFKRSKTELPPKVLLSAHMDEVGLIITDVTEEGYFKFASVGGIDPKVLIAQRVNVNGLKGVISTKAVHLTTAEERKQNLSEDKLYIDIGAKDKNEAQKVAKPGDYCVFDSKYTEFGNQIKAKALDDRIGCAIMIEILKKDWPVDLYCNFTVQEEVGLRGARVASRGINPDYAVVIEGTTCNDLPGVEANLRVTKIGAGPAISILDSASKGNEELIALLEKSATRHNIPYQFKASTAGGNDAGTICITDGGIKTASLSVPCRYIHSPVCVMNKSDFENCRRLIEVFLEDMGKDGKIND